MVRGRCTAFAGCRRHESAGTPSGQLLMMKLLLQRVRKRARKNVVEQRNNLQQMKPTSVQFFNMHAPSQPYGAGEACPPTGSCAGRCRSVGQVRVQRGCQVTRCWGLSSEGQEACLQHGKR